MATDNNNDPEWSDSARPRHELGRVGVQVIHSVGRGGERWYAHEFDSLST